MNIKRKMKTVKIKQKCPYCFHNKLWESKTNVGRKCLKCKRQILHDRVSVKDKHERMISKLVIK